MLSSSTINFQKLLSDLLILFRLDDMFQVGALLKRVGLFCCFVQVIMGWTSDPKEWFYCFPPDSGVVNVKDYGAVGDGIHDDTQAINQAIIQNLDKNRYRSNPIIWLPKGTYKITGPIEGRISKTGWSGGWRAMFCLVGESRLQTVIRLADRSPGYDNPKQKKWVIATGSENDLRGDNPGGGNRAFRHAIMNLTLEIGQGNPGAVAIDFITNNRGTIDNVTIRSACDSGLVGIDLTRHWPGPGLITNVTIEGFDTAIAVAHYQYGMTFEHVWIRNPRRIAIENQHNVLAMRRIRYEGTVPFYRSSSEHNMLCLLDSELIYQGTVDQPSPPAISTGGYLVLHRVSFTGFLTRVEENKRGKVIPRLIGEKEDRNQSQMVNEFLLGNIVAPWTNQARFLMLPIEEVPVLRPSSRDQWVNGGSSWESIQGKIDEGAEWIYIRPNQKVTLNQPLILRNRVRLLLGLNAHFEGPPNSPAVIIDDGLFPEVAMENIYIDGKVLHRSGRTFVFRHGDLAKGYEAIGKGKSHIVDIIGKPIQINQGHQFWGRQINSEFGEDPLFLNRGQSWLLGFKMESSTRNDAKKERGTPCILNEEGGRLELFGGLLYTLGNQQAHAPAVPAFINTKGSMSLAFRLNGVPATWYPIIMREGTLTEGKDFRVNDLKTHGAALLYHQFTP